MNPKASASYVFSDKKTKSSGAAVIVTRRRAGLEIVAKYPDEYNELNMCIGEGIQTYRELGVALREASSELDLEEPDYKDILKCLDIVRPGLARRLRKPGRPTVELHREEFSTGGGGEVTVSVDVFIGKKVHELVLFHSSSEGSERMFSARFSTPNGLRTALEEAESGDFDLSYDLSKMAKQAKKIPGNHAKIFAEMLARRAMEDVPIKHGNHTYTILSRRASREKYGRGSYIFFGSPQSPPAAKRNDLT